MNNALRIASPFAKRELRAFIADLPALARAAATDEWGATAGTAIGSVVDGAMKAIGPIAEKLIDAAAVRISLAIVDAAKAIHRDDYPAVVLAQEVDIDPRLSGEGE